MTPWCDPATMRSLDALVRFRDEYLCHDCGQWFGEEVRGALVEARGLMRGRALKQMKVKYDLFAGWEIVL